MNRRFRLPPSGSERTCALGLVICGALFLCGCIVGTVAAGLMDDAAQLNNYVTGYFSLFLSGSATKRQLLPAIFEACKYHLAALFLGFSVLGVVCVPLLAAVRGFFLSFSVSAIVRLLGGKGVFATLSVFGVNTLITIPCFFILSVTAFSASLHLFRLVFRNSSKIGPPGFALRVLRPAGICLAVLLASALIDTYVTPHLIGLAVRQLQG